MARSRLRTSTSSRSAGAAFARLVDVMATLRGRHGCPWDLKQTHETLRPFLLEECYEAIDAIDRGDHAALEGELGDVLLQCVFHAQIAREAGRFNIRDVIAHLVGKLIERHPHVFDRRGVPLTPAERRLRKLDTAGQVKEQWERVKARERTRAGRTTRLLSGLPRALPALTRASKIGTRAATVGFDWPHVDGVLDKIDEEVRELRAAASQSPDALRDELGDVLFSIANLARKLGIDPELALSRANDKFTQRFDRVESHLERRGLTVHTARPDEMEAAWNTIKRKTTRRAPASTPPPKSTRPAPRRRSRP